MSPQANDYEPKPKHSGPPHESGDPPHDEALQVGRKHGKVSERTTEQTIADKTRRRSRQAPCGSTQELEAPSQTEAEEQRTLERAPYPPKRDYSPARLGLPTATALTARLPPHHETAQPALRKKEQRS